MEGRLQRGEERILAEASADLQQRVDERDLGARRLELVPVLHAGAAVMRMCVIVRRNRHMHDVVERQDPESLQAGDRRAGQDSAVPQRGPGRPRQRGRRVHAGPDPDERPRRDRLSKRTSADAARVELGTPRNRSELIAQGRHLSWTPHAAMLQRLRSVVSREPSRRALATHRPGCGRGVASPDRRIYDPPRRRITQSAARRIVYPPRWTWGGRREGAGGSAGQRSRVRRR